MVRDQEADEVDSMGSSDEDEEGTQSRQSLGGCKEQSIGGRRLVGVEKNWYLSVASGTGTTVALGVLKAPGVGIAALQTAAEEVQRQHPLMRCWLVKGGGVSQPEFQLSSEPYVEVQHFGGTEEIARGGQDWHELLEKELNRPITPVKVEVNGEGEQERWPLFEVHVQELAEGRQAVVLRVHSAGCDFPGSKQVLETFLTTLNCIVGEEWHGPTEMEQALPPALMDAVPRDKAKKSFWRRGTDLVGYSVGGLKGQLLPLESWIKEGRPGVRTAVEHVGLDQGETVMLRAACDKRKCTMYGAIAAAALKATKTVKGGENQEKFTVSTMVNCRSIVKDPLPASTCAFFNAAMMHNHDIHGKTEFWDLACRCTESVQQSIDKNKHFKDLRLLNGLFTKALAYPSLTPHGSRRLGLLTLDAECVESNVRPFKHLQLERTAGCSSVHGVSPCVGLFYYVEDGCLQMFLAYPTMFPRSQLQALGDELKSLLVTSW